MCKTRKLQKLQLHYNITLFDLKEQNEFQSLNNTPPPAHNMLKSRGLYHGQGWQALEGIRNNLEEYRDRNRAEIFDEVLKGALARPRAIRKQISE